MTNNPYDIDMPNLLKLQRMEDIAMHLLPGPVMASASKIKFQRTTKLALTELKTPATLHAAIEDSATSFSVHARTGKNPPEKHEEDECYNVGGCDVCNGEHALDKAGKSLPFTQTELQAKAFHLRGGGGQDKPHLHRCGRPYIGETGQRTYHSHLEACDRQQTRSPTLASTQTTNQAGPAGRRTVVFNKNDWSTELHLRGGTDEPSADCLEGCLTPSSQLAGSAHAEQPIDAHEHQAGSKGSSRYGPPVHSRQTTHAQAKSPLLDVEEMILTLQACFESHPHWTHHELADLLEQPKTWVLALLHEIALYGPWKAIAADPFCWRLPPADEDELIVHLHRCFTFKSYWSTHDLACVFKLPESKLAQVLTEIAIYGPWSSGNPQKWSWKLKPGREVSGLRWKGKDRAMPDSLSAVTYNGALQ
ncbi:putative winged helix-like DNA-binding domain superfamily, TFIIF beta subunit, HTH [Septoria linicola]|nr:putative winged helix-like DNA-binding domain superfamily, TFIIF beta subunit, HTH [Septoria linicola]